MENMKKVAQLLDNIRNVGSTNAKAFLLDEYVNSENGDLLKNVLVYCYDPFRMFGLTLPTLEKIKPKFATMTVTTQEDIFKLLDELYVSNINDSLRERAKMTLMAIEDETTTEMVQGIMCKDLKIGMNIKSINKVCPGLLPEFNVQLAESLAKQKDGALYGQQIWITPKLDGFRIIVDIETNKAYTRKGQEYEGIEHIFDGAKKLSDMLQQLTGIDEPFILDGELVHEPVEGKTSGELYSMTSSLARKKGRVKEKMKLRFNVFDFVPRSQFLSGKTTMCYGKRRTFLDEAFMQNYHFVVDVPCLYHGEFDMDIVNNLLKEIEADGGEGLMINLNAPYQTKRTKDVLKVKSFFDADLLVLDVYEGKKGKEYEGTLGGVTVKFLFNGQEMTTNVGSGFSKEERELYFNNPELIVGKIIECKYFEITTSKNDKTKKDLRFCTYQHRIREDKDENDITDVAL